MAVEEKSKKDDAKSEKDDAKARDGDAKKDDAKAKKDADAERTETEGKKRQSESASRGGPSLSSKIGRAFLFTFLSTFITAILFADSLPNGLRVDFDLIASLKLALIAGVISVVLRGLAALLPLFADDHDKKSKKKDD